MSRFEVMGRVEENAVHQKRGQWDIVEFTVVEREVNRQTQKEKVCACKITAFGTKLLAIAKSLKKGDQVIVIGKMEDRSYEYQGKMRTAKNFNADIIGIAGRAGTGAPMTPKTPEPPPPPPPPEPEQEAFEGELPF